MAVNWMMGAAGDVAGRFQEGLEYGRRQRQENELLALRRQEMEQRQTEHQEDRQSAQQTRIREAAQLLGPIYQQLSKMPYEQRRTYLQQIAPRLTARGIPAEMVASYDPTDENLNADMALSQQHGAGQPTEFQRNYEYLQQRDPSAANNYLRRQTEPQPRVIIGPNGQPFIVQGGGADQAPADQPQEIENPATGERMRLDPQTNQWVPVQGGPQASNPAATFP